MTNDERDHARVESQPSTETAELPQRPTEDVPPTAPDRATPGPWRMRPGVCRRDHPDTSADVHGRDGQFVADCGCHDNATANARLIAAAPELLDALKAVLEQFDAGMFVRNTDSDGCSDWAIKAAKPLMALAKASAAITKAEGA